MEAKKRKMIIGEVCKKSLCKDTAGQNLQSVLWPYEGEEISPSVYVLNNVLLSIMRTGNLEMDLSWTG